MTIDREELLKLLEALCDGTITPAQHERLQERLAAEASARQLYFDYLDLRLHLRQWQQASSGEQSSGIAGPGAVLSAPIVIETSPAYHAPLSTLYSSLGGFAFSYAAAVVIVGIGLLIAWAYQVSIPRADRQQVARVGSQPALQASRPEPEMAFVGRVTGMVDCQWADPSTEPFNGASVPLRRKYALAAGLMEITYDAGAKIILEGPCTYQVESKTGGYLSLGRLTAKVEKRGEGRGEREENLANRQFVNGNPRHPSPLFSICTPTTVVSDLGTEFGVEVGKEGHTISHVFRGAIRVQTLSANGKPEGVGTILRENESARVDDRGASRVAILPPSAKPVSFVRELPKRTMKVFDLVDAVCGGDGFSGRRNRGIDPTNGRIIDVDSNKAMYPVSDGKYHRALGLPFVDGIFIPKGGKSVVQLDSAGHTFAEFNNSEDKSSCRLWTGGKARIGPPLAPPLDKLRDIPVVLGGVDYSLPPHGFLLLHANKGVTFDLKAIRQANRGCKLLRFRAMTANAEIYSHLVGGTNRADLWVFLDGQECFKRKSINGYSSGAPVAVPIGDQNRYLTLVGTDGGDGINADWIVFGDPRLEMVYDAKVAPDLLPIPSQAITPKGEEVHRK